MKKTFIYEVAGQEREDTTAWGTAWKWAQEMAQATGSEIRRTVIERDHERYEFLASGKVFLNMNHYTPEKALHY